MCSPPTCSAAEGTATGVRQAGKQEQVKIVSFDAGPTSEALKRTCRLWYAAAGVDW